LCKVALLTVTPPTNTGLSLPRASGAGAADLHVDLDDFGLRLFGRKLVATAKRGARETKPSSRCCASALTLYTTPSMSYGSLARC
jgi:hypothetical protein